MIRRNHEDDDDDNVVVDLNEDEQPEVVTKDVLEYEALMKGKIDFFYKRQDHQLMKIFYLLVQPSDEEKMPIVVLKIIDNFLGKGIPKICDFFIFNSLRRVLQRTDWLKPASEEINMQKINDLKRNFITMFPFVGKEGELAHLATSIGKVDLNYYINNENMITGDPRENFDSRKTKIKDENY